MQLPPGSSNLMYWMYKAMGMSGISKSHMWTAPSLQEFL
jgi:hypothetical protein